MDESGTTDQPSQIETKIKQLIEDSQKDIGEGGALKTQVAYLEEGLEKNIGNSVSRVTQFEKEVIHDERRAKKEIIHQSSLCKSVIISNLKNIKKIYLLFQNSLVILGIAFFFLIIAYGLYISGFVPGQYFIFGFSIIFVIFIIYI